MAPENIPGRRDNACLINVRKIVYLLMHPFVDPCDFCATALLRGLFRTQLLDLVTETANTNRADMAKRTSSTARSAAVRAGDEPSRKATNDLSHDAFRKLLWEITSINVHLDQIRAYWAQ